MTLRFTVLFLFILPLTLFAQEEIKFGKIPFEDLQMTVYEQDTSANAVVLMEKGGLGFGFIDEKIHVNIHRRIKVLKRAGFDQGDIAIQYNSYNNRSEVIGLKVKIFSPNGSSIDMSGKDVFEEKVNDYVSVMKFSVPNLQVGSVIEYKYKLITKDVFALQRWSFQKEIPVRLSEYIVTIPKWYKYVKLTKGGPINYEQVEGRVPNVNTETIRYYAENLPAMKEENFVTTMEDYRANIQFQLSSVEVPGKMVEYIMTSWDKIKKELEVSKYFGNQYLKKRKHAIVVKAATEKIGAIDGEMDKMKAAYSFVLDNIKWNDYYGYMASQELSKTYDEKIGTSADMNLMLLALLKNEGIKASPVLISTRGHGQPVELYPFLSQFNHVIILAEADGKSYFLDATEKNRPIGFPEINSLNKRGWLISEEPRWIDIDAPKSDDVFMTNLSLDAEGTLKGDFLASCSGYSGINEREAAKDDKAGKYWQTRLSEYNEEAEILEISYEGMDLNDKKMKANITCNIPEAAQVNGDYMYLSPIIYSNFDENPFKLEKRLYPVEIPYPFKEQLIVNLTIPEGYAVEELPEQINLVLANNGAKYQYLISQKENTLQIISKIQIKQLFFSPAEYKSIKGFFDVILEKQGEQIVLKKI